MKSQEVSVQTQSEPKAQHEQIQISKSFRHDTGGGIQAVQPKQVKIRNFVMMPKRRAEISIVARW